MAVQDCWRSKEKLSEQLAVRSIMRKMNIEIIELCQSFEKTDFCGVSLYRPAPPRNLKLAPKRFVENAAGKFLPHTPEEQKAIMEEYCRTVPAETVVSYCHYCADGIKIGGKNSKHLAELLFK